MCAVSTVEKAMRMSMPGAAQIRQKGMRSEDFLTAATHNEKTLTEFRYIPSPASS